MGVVIEDLEDHEGYAARRLPDGTLTGTWTLRHPRVRRLCGRLWLRLARQRRLPADRDRRSSSRSTSGGPSHAEPLLARQAQQRRAGARPGAAGPWRHRRLRRQPGQPGPDRPGRRPGPELVDDLQRDLDRQTLAREPTVNADRPDPAATAPSRSGRTANPTPSRDAHRPAVSGAVSTLDRVTLQLGVAVAVVIALLLLCGVGDLACTPWGSRPATAGGRPPPSRWSPMGRPSTACSGSSAAPAAAPRGPATAGCWSSLRDSGLDRRQRRPRPTRPGRPGHRRRHPPGRAGHAGRPQGRRRRGHPPGRPGRGPAPRGHARPSPPQLPQATTVRRSDPTANLTLRRHSAPAAGAARRTRSRPTATTVGARLQTGLCPTAAGRPALDGPHPGRGRRLWPQQRRQLPATPTPTGRGARPMSRPSWQLRDAALGYASRGIPVLPLHYPLPHRATSSRFAATDTSHPAAGTGCSCRDPGCGQVWQAPPGQPGPPRGQGRHHVTGPGSWPGGPATPRPTSAWPPGTASTSWTSTAPPAPRPSETLAATHGLAELGAAGPHRWGWLALLPGPHRPRATSARSAWRVWTGGAGAATWSPHPAATPPATPTSGSPAAISRPHWPRCPAVLLERLQPRQRPRPTGPVAAPAAGADGRATATRGRPWPRSWPGSPPPRSASATGSCGSRPATSTTWSPPAPSTTARSTKGCWPPPSAAGCSLRSPARPAAPWPRAARSASTTPAAHPSPPTPNAPTPRRSRPTGGRRAVQGEEVMAMAAAGQLAG